MNYNVMPGMKYRPKFKRDGAVIIDTVMDYFKIDPEKLSGKNRRRNIVTARHIAYYLLRHECGMTLAEIGRLLNRDHTSVLHGIKTMADMIYTKNPHVVKCFEDIRGLLK